MLKQRAYKYRFYPTKEQAEVLEKTFGSCRYVYNWALYLRTQAYYEEHRRVSYKETSSELTKLKRQPETIWLNEVSSVALQQELRHLDSAFRNFFAGRAKYPKFKSKKNRQSVSYMSSGFSWDGECLALAKMDKPLKIRWSRRFIGTPSSVTVSRDTAGRYFISFLVEEEIKELPRLETAVGVDLGLKDFAVLSNGSRFGNEKFFAKDEMKLAKAQRDMCRKQKGSKNRAKARLKVAKIHARITDRRNDFLHKLSTRLIRENQTIAVESLQVKNMVRTRCFAKSISDAAWGEFLRMCGYKSEWYSRDFVQIDKFYPSSKRCHVCGRINNSLQLCDRIWTCVGCGTIHERDENAAINISAVGQTVLASGEAVRPGRMAASNRASLDEGGIPRL